MKLSRNIETLARTLAMRASDISGISLTLNEEPSSKAPGPSQRRVQLDWNGRCSPGSYASTTDWGNVTAHTILINHLIIWANSIGWNSIHVGRQLREDFWPI